RTDVIPDRHGTHCGLPLSPPQYLLPATYLRCNPFGESASTQVGIRPHCGIQSIGGDAIRTSRPGAENCAINSQMMGGRTTLTFIQVRPKAITAHPVIDLVAVAGNMKAPLLAALALSPRGSQSAAARCPRQACRALPHPNKRNAGPWRASRR